MSLGDKQVSNNENFHFPPLFLSIEPGRKQIRIGAVVNHGAANLLLHSVSQKLLDSFADTNCGAAGAIDVDRSLAPPLGSHAAAETPIEHIQAVKRHDEWNVQSPRQQGGRVPAR